MKKLLIVIPAVLLLIFCSCRNGNKSVCSELTVHIADVGKADMILIKCGDSFGLIDAGYKSNRAKAEEILDSYGVKTLEFAVATHNDKDHIGGMARIIEKYEPKTLYINQLEGEGKQYGNMLEAAALKGTEVVKLRCGDAFSLGDASFTVLSPDKSLLDLNDENESSIVLRMTHGDKSVLFMGDAQLKAEEFLMKKYSKELICDVIKIGHHGSAQSSSAVFLSETKAEYAVISTGDDEPASAITLKAINACNMKLYNTDTDGDIIIRSDGSAVTVEKKGK